MNTIEIGSTKGEACNRGECIGIIAEHESDSGCSCHTMPPCSYCVDDRNYCPECGWEGLEDQQRNQYTDDQLKKFQAENGDRMKRSADKRGRIYNAFNGLGQLESIEWYVIESWHSGYRAKGCKPPSATQEEVIKKFNFDLPRYSFNEHGGFIISGFTD